LKKVILSDFGEVDGKKAVLYTMENNNNVKISITNYGGIITSIFSPDKNGNLADIVLGFNTLDEYIKDSPYFGCIIGRFGNRIKKASFSLNDKNYTLAGNDNGNHLHGGNKGFDKIVWDSTYSEQPESTSLIMTHISPDGDEGYPGTLKTVVTYSLNEENELTIHYHAVTDKDTIINLTNHTYFNLAGEGAGDILGHSLQLNAASFTVVDNEGIPTGEIRNVAETPMDFTSHAIIKDKLATPYEQLNLGPGGIDHNFILNNENGELITAAVLSEPTSGRTVTTSTTEPGIQCYTGNFLEGLFKGKSGKLYEKHHGICLETQHYPDSPNHAEFPSTVLKPGELFDSTTIYKFSV
jgi:aldose 1-epimerase